MGRPSTYSEEIAETFCDLIATTSQSIRTICKREDMPAISSIFKWLSEIPSFSEQYTRAQDMRADLLVEEMIDIVDDGSNDLMTITKGDVSYDLENKEVTSRSKLRFEARKWIASKLKPKKYGDRTAVEHDIPPGSEIIIRGQKFADNG